MVTTVPGQWLAIIIMILAALFPPFPQANHTLLKKSLPYLLWIVTLEAILCCSPIFLAFYKSSLETEVHSFTPHTFTKYILSGIILDMKHNVTDRVTVLMQLTF